MKKLLFLAAIIVAQMGLSGITIKPRFLRVEMENHPTIKIGDTTVDNVLIRSATIMSLAGFMTYGIARGIYEGDLKSSAICAVAAPFLAVTAAAELATGSFKDIVSHAANNDMIESTIMNALDLW